VDKRAAVGRRRVLVELRGNASKNGREEFEYEQEGEGSFNSQETWKGNIRGAVRKLVARARPLSGNDVLSNTVDIATGLESSASGDTRSEKSTRSEGTRSGEP